MQDLRITYIALADLAPFARNPRTHSRKQIRQIADSINAFGFTNPVIIDRESIILAGHGRLAAAKFLATEKVPCVRIETMTPAQKRAYVLADNKLVLNAGWDEEVLAVELKGLLEIDASFDIGLTGFSSGEVDGLIEGLAIEDAPAPREERLPSPRGGQPVTRPGNVWLLGHHRLICGDALSPEVISKLMAGETAEMVFTDPPYNVPIDGNVSGLGHVKHREFAMAAGEMSKLEFTSFLEKALRNFLEHSKDGSIHFICMDWRHLQELRAVGDKVYTQLKNLIVWVQDNGGMGTFLPLPPRVHPCLQEGKCPSHQQF